MKDLEIDHELHRYRFQGRPIGGVSEIIGSLGLIDRSVYDDWSRDRGIAVHKAIELHLTGELDRSTIDPRIQGYFDAALKFMLDAGIVPGPHTYVEELVFHPVYHYAGTPDLVTVAFGVPAVVDFKSGGLGVAGLQTAFYEMAARIVFPVEKPRRRMAVQLKADGGYKKTDLQDGFDFVYAQSCASLFNAFILPRKIAATKGATHAAA